MLLDRTGWLLGIYIALYIGIPANGIDEIFGFNIQIIILVLTLISYMTSSKGVSRINKLTIKYVSVQLFFAITFILSSILLSNINYYGTLMNFVQFSVLMFLICQVINENNFKAFLQFFVFGCLLNSMLVLFGPYFSLQTINYGGIEENRITIIGRDNNESSMIHNMSIAIALYFLREKKRVVLNIVAIVLTIFTMMNTGSRTGLVACLFLLIINFLMTSKGIRQRIILLLGSIVLLGGVYFIATQYLDDSMLERYMNIREELEEGTMTNRTIIWSYIISAFIDSSLFEQIFGHGWNTTSLFTFRGYDAHNVFLKMAIEFGIIGVIILSLYLLFFLKYVYQQRKSSEGFLVGGVIICVLISFMTLSWIYNIIIWIVFIFMHKVIIYTK